MSNKGNEPFFSVIICTYNRAGIIRRALDSLVSQQETDWEGIVVDDGSSDNSAAIVRPYLADYPIRYYLQTHSGLAAARNAGMQTARGKYLTFLDSDDRYKPEHLWVRKRLLAKNPEIELLHSNVTIIGDPFVPDKDHPGQKIHINNCVVGGTFCIKRSSLSAEDVFHNQFSDDSAFLERWARKGKKIQKAGAPTYCYYRDLADSLCNRRYG